MRNVVAQRFSKGINVRLPIDRFDSDPQRLYTLQNARLTSRGGDTYYVRRIEGSAPVGEGFYPFCVDVKVYKNFIVVLYKQDRDSFFHYIDIVSTADPKTPVIPEPFVYGGVNTRDVGKLVLLEDTILVAPHNKQLNYLDGTWYFNDFISTTPLLEAKSAIPGNDPENQQAGKYKATIRTESGVTNATTVGDFARVYVRMKDVPTLNGNQFGFTITIIFDGVQISPPSFDSNASQTDVLNTLANIINTPGTGLSTKWSAEYSGDNPEEEYLIITSKTVGIANNGVALTISVSPDEPSALKLGIVTNLWQVGVPGSFTNGLTGQTIRGLNPNEYAGIIINFGGKIVSTRVFLAGETKIAVATEISNVLVSVLQDYEVVLENEGDVTITAKQIGSKYNPNTIEISNPTGAFIRVIPISLGLNVEDGDFLVTDTLWYTARNVYRDGHKTKTAYPVLGVVSEESNKIQLLIKPTLDLDNTFCAVEIFRKTSESPFYFIKKIKPQTTDPDKEGYLLSVVASLKFIYADPTGFPAQEETTFIFKLGDFITPEITVSVEDDEIVWLKKIYEAFYGIDGFTSKWNITLPEEAGPIVFQAKIASTEFNNVNLEVQGEALRVLLPNTTIGVLTTTTFTDTQVLNLATPTETKLYTNDILSFVYNNVVENVTVSENVEIGASIIPIVETVFTPASTVVKFVRGDAYSDFGYIKQEEGESPYFYLADDGLVDVYELDEKDYVWSQSHYTHELVRDRYVRANLNFESKELGVQDGLFNITEQESSIEEEDTTPFYSNSVVYAQGRYNDGTTSFFEEIGRFDTTTESERLSLSQQTVVNQEVKEYGFYAKYTPKRRPFVEANGLGFANINLPTQLSSKYKKDDSGELEYIRQPFNPVSPRVFLGFSHIRRDFNLADTTPKYVYFVDQVDMFEFNLDEELKPSAAGDGQLKVEDTQDITMQTPNIIDFEYGGSVTKYVLESVGNSTATYVSMTYLGLKNLLDKVPLFYEIKSFTSANNEPFAGVNSKELEGFRARITGYELVKNPAVQGLNTGALFINLEAGTVLDKVSAQITKKVLSGTDFATDKHSFMANPITVNDGPKIRGVVIGLAVENDSIFGIDEKVESIVYLGRKDNKVDTEPIKLLTGYITDSITENFAKLNITIFFSKLKDSNIYGTLLLQTDIPYVKENYPNQIMWSEPFVLNSYANGHRNFLPVSFMNIPPDYGNVVGLEYINNRLLVFTERGVAVVNVGEVLTQQVGGEVFVDTTGFLNGYQWALTSIPMIMPKTIVRYENVLFFSDGIDVWQYDGQFKNISDGAIPLTGQGFGIGLFGQPGDPTGGVGPGQGTGGNSGGGGPGSGTQTGSGLFMGSSDIYWGQDNRFMGEDGTGTSTGDEEDPETPDPDEGNGDDFVPTDPKDGSGVGTVGVGSWVGVIDPYNKEYRLSDNITTYAFSIEFAEWFGPYTYRDQGSDFTKNQMYSVVDRRLTRQNIGSTFNGFEYDTIIESVGNVMERPDMVKIWRKFYLDVVINGKQPGQYNPGDGGGSGGVGVWWGSDEFYMGELNVYMGDNSDGGGAGGLDIQQDEDADVPEGAPNVLGINKVFFSYRKQTYLPYRTFDLGFAKIKNNRYNIGIVNAHQNSEQLYWKIKTKEPQFVLKMIAFEYVKRERR